MTHDLPIHLGKEHLPVQVVLHQEHLDGICTLIHFCEGVSSAGKGHPPGMYELVMHYRNLRSALYQPDEGDVVRKYHEVMQLLLELRMPHGKCKPREDRACTACNARDTLDRLVEKYQGLTVQPLQSVGDSGQTPT